MIVKTLALVISMSLTLSSTITKTPTFIPVDINFCEFSSGKGESICSIQESEYTSRNKIFFDINGENPKLLVDKRNVTSEKAKYVFQNDMITIDKPNQINMPYNNRSLLIEPGNYEVEVTNKGYIISLGK